MRDRTSDLRVNSSNREQATKLLRHPRRSDITRTLVSLSTGMGPSCDESCFASHLFHRMLTAASRTSAAQGIEGHPSTSQIPRMASFAPLSTLATYANDGAAVGKGGEAYFNADLQGQDWKGLDENGAVQCSKVSEKSRPSILLRAGSMPKNLNRSFAMAIEGGSYPGGSFIGATMAPANWLGTNTMRQMKFLHK